jgi:hypothetical protein
MRTLALLLLSILPCAAAAAAPSNTQTNVSTVGRPVCLSLVNISGKSRQVRLKSGVVELPVGQRVDIDSRVGATLYIVSDTNRSVDEQILIGSSDDARVIRIQ